VQLSQYQKNWTDALNRGDVSAADQVFAPDCIVHINGGPQPDLSVDGFKQFVSAIIGAFPDVHFTMEDHVVSGDKAATRWVAEGTHTGALGPIAATGRRVRVNGMILDRTMDGRVAERWELWDQAGLLQQLGV
jgi:steroid delta-isomerase-like uncharacterized protein